MIDDPIFYAAVIPAVILCGLGKGGFTGAGVLAMPLTALVVSPVKGAAILLPILCIQDLVGVWAYRRAFDRWNLAVMLPGACMGIGLGYLFASRVPDAAIALAVGLVSVWFGASRLVIERKGPVEPTGKPWRIVGVFWGVVSGFTSTIANAGAPPFQVYVLPQRLQKDIFVGTGIMFFAIMNWMKLPVFFALGQFTRENVVTSLGLFPLAVASTFGGLLLVRKVPAERFYRIIYLLLVVVGAKLLWDGSKLFTYTSS